MQPTRNPFADLVPGGGGGNPFADLVPDGGRGNSFSDLTADLGRSVPAAPDPSLGEYLVAGDQEQSDVAQAVLSSGKSLTQLPVRGLLGIYGAARELARTPTEPLAPGETYPERLARAGEAEMEKPLPPGAAFVGGAMLSGPLAAVGAVSEFAGPPTPGSMRIEERINWLPGKIRELAHYGGDVAVRYTNSPMFGAAVATFGELAAYTLLLKAAKGAVGGVKGARIRGKVKAEVETVDAGFQKTAQEYAKEKGLEETWTDAQEQYGRELLAEHESPSAVISRSRAYFGEEIPGPAPPKALPPPGRASGPWESPPIPETGIDTPAALLSPGDVFTIRGERYRHAGYDSRGNALVKDGKTYKVGPNETLPVDDGLDSVLDGPTDPFRDQATGLYHAITGWEKGGNLVSDPYTGEITGRTGSTYPRWFKEQFPNDTAATVQKVIGKYLDEGEGAIRGKKERRIFETVNDIVQDAIKNGEDVVTGRPVGGLLRSEAGHAPIITDAAQAVGARGRNLRAMFLDVFAPARLAGKEHQNLLLREAGLKDAANVDSDFFWNKGVRKEIPDDLARQAMTVYIQTNGDAALARSYLARIAEKNPKLAEGVSQVISRMERLTPEEKGTATAIRQHFNEMFEKGRDAEVLHTYLDGYLTQMWKERKLGRKGGVGGGELLNPRFKFAKERFYANYLEGMAEGLVPYTLDVADIGRAYDAALAKTIFHRRMVDTLKRDGFIRSGSEKGIPSDWQFSDDLIPGEGRLAIHPDAAPVLKQFIKRSSFTDYALFSNIKKMAVASKQMILSLSPFHYANLFKNAADVMRHGRDPVTVLMDGVRMNADHSTVRWWAERNLKVGEQDAGIAYMNMAKATIGEASNSAWKKVSGPLYRFYRRNQEILWREYVPALKLANAELEMAARLKKNPGLDLDATARQIAEVMNRKYGVLNWEGMGTTRFAKDAMQLLLLAPDWTFSNFMFARSAFKPGVEGSVARRDWLMSLFIWQTLLNSLNYAFSGHSAWSNPDGKRMYLHLPGKSKEGRNFYAEYLQPGSMRDINRFISGFGNATEWQRLANGKLQPLLRAAYELASNRDWAGEPIVDPNADSPTQWMQGIGHLVAVPTPIPLRAVADYATGSKEPIQAVSNLLGVGAVTKGPSAYAIEQKARTALKEGNTEKLHEAMEDAAREGQRMNLRRVLRSDLWRRMNRERRAGQSPFPRLYRATH